MKKHWKELLLVAWIPVLALVAIGAGIIRTQPMPAEWDDGHGFRFRLTTNGFVTQRGTSAPVTSAFGGGGGVGYSSWTGRLVFDGTNAPAVTVISNGLPQTLSWVAQSVGEVKAALTNSANNIFLLATPDFTLSGVATLCTFDSNTVYLDLFDTTSGTAISVGAVYLEVRVYP